MSWRIESSYISTHLQGLHLLRLSMAVNWTEVDHVLFGCVSRLNVLSSSLITPLPAAASSTSRACSASRLAETRVSGRRRRARIGVHNILESCWRNMRDVSDDKKGNPEVDREPTSSFLK